MSGEVWEYRFFGRTLWCLQEGCIVSKEVEEESNVYKRVVWCQRGEYGV